RRFVVWRGPSDGRRYERASQLQPVVGLSRRRDVGEASFIQRGHEEIAGAARTVPRKEAPRAVGTVRRGREADDQQPRTRIAKAGHRLRPIDIVAIGASLFPTNLLAVRAKARAPLTLDDLFTHREQLRNRHRLMRLSVL